MPDDCPLCSSTRQWTRDIYNVLSVTTDIYSASEQMKGEAKQLVALSVFGTTPKQEKAESHRSQKSNNTTPHFWEEGAFGKMGRKDNNEKGMSDDEHIPSELVIGSNTPSGQSTWYLVDQDHFCK